MASTPASTLVCFDLLGTTVIDGSVAERAVREAVATQGIVPGTSAFTKAMVQAHRSWGQANLFSALFPGDEARAWAVSSAFDRAFASLVARSGLTPAPGAEEVFAQLRGAGVRVCLLTSLPQASLERVLNALHWRPIVDLAVSGPACPEPGPVLYAARRLGVADTAEVAVVGDTTSDIEYGRAAGVGMTIGVTTGVHTPERLRAAGATYVVDGVSEVPPLILGQR